MGSSPLVPRLRPCRLLRFVEEQTRHEALPSDEASGHPLVRAGRALDVVLRRRGGGGDLLSPRRVARLRWWIEVTGSRGSPVRIGAVRIAAGSSVRFPRPSLRPYKALESASRPRLRATPWNLNAFRICVSKTGNASMGTSGKHPPASCGAPAPHRGPSFVRYFIASPVRCSSIWKRRKRCTASSADASVVVIRTRPPFSRSLYR